MNAAIPSFSESKSILMKRFYPAPSHIPDIPSTLASHELNFSHGTEAVAIPIAQIYPNLHPLIQDDIPSNSWLMMRHDE
jgi:hypothetical protein